MTKDEVYELIDRYEKDVHAKVVEDVELLRKVVYSAETSDVSLGPHKLGFRFEFKKESALEIWSEVPIILMPLKKNRKEQG